MTKNLKTAVFVLGTLAMLVAAFSVARAHGQAIKAAVGVGSAQAAPTRSATPALPPAPINSLALAVQALQQTSQSFASRAGLTAADIAQTRSIFSFDGALGNFAAGIGVYKTPLSNGGYCLTFAAATSCTATQPTLAEPLIGIGFDPDADRAGEPFIVFSIRNPAVKSVSYVCADQTYPAHITSDVVWFVGPTSSLSLDDCSEQVTFSDGHSLTKPV